MEQVIISTIDSTMTRYFTAILLLVCLTSCTSNEVYYKFESLPQNNWSKAHAVCFALDSVSEKKRSSYNLSIEIAHNLIYSYKNLWLLVDYMRDGAVLSSDTLNVFLIDNTGKWLGNGNGPTRQLSVLFKTDFAINREQHHQICIRHSMRDIQLKGIEKIGLKIY